MALQLQLTIHGRAMVQLFILAPLSLIGSLNTSHFVVRLSFQALHYYFIS